MIEGGCALRRIACKTSESVTRGRILEPSICIQATQAQGSGRDRGIREYPTMGKNIGRIAVATLLVAVSAIAVADDSKERAIAAGKTHFINNCAACHGEDGQGGGAMSGELEKSPTNLTLLTKTNGGAFPFEEIYDTIDGREQVGAHGPRDMPVWGVEYKMGVPTSAGTSESVVRGKILELILYIESIQE